MHKKILLLNLIVLSLLTSCHVRSNISANPFPMNQHNEYSIPITYIFSNDENIEEESSYYDAVLQFNRVHPGKMKFINIVSMEEESLIDFYHIDVFPTLLVVFDAEEILKIEGYKASEDIYNELEQSIIIDKNIDKNT